MMEAEGYSDSETSENYRQFLKSRRRAHGVLPQKEKFADYLSDMKLESLKHEVGNLKYAKQDAQDEYRRLNKVRREISREIVLLELIEEELKQYDWGVIPNSKTVKPRNDDSKILLVTLNDIHYGYEHDAYYGLSTAEQVLENYFDKIIEYGVHNNVEEVVVANLGDLIEGRLRNQSIVDSTLSATQQMVKITYIIIEQLKRLTQHFNVAYFALSGNHDRISENKNDNLERESHVTTHNEIIKQLSKDSDLLEFIETDSMYHHIMTIRGKNIYFCHGDRDALRNNNLLANLSLNYGINLDYVIGGHLHSYSMTEVGDGKYQIITGSIKGSDSFSDRINKKSSRSQFGILFDSEGQSQEFIIKL